jgi:hypothetical protein
MDFAILPVAADIGHGNLTNAKRILKNTLNLS